MGDIPVDVALHIRAQHAEGPLWDAETARPSPRFADDPLVPALGPDRDVSTLRPEKGDTR
jgi:hypothetical protein